MCYMSEREDRDFLVSANYLHSQKVFGADRLGLKEDFCIPLPAAVVELSSLDMHTTPLDKMTCIYDAVQQVKFYRQTLFSVALIDPFIESFRNVDKHF